MVLHVGADAGQRMHDRHADLLEMRRVADPRELQQMRRVDRARAQQDLALGLGPLGAAAPGQLDRDRPFPLEHDPPHHRLGDELKVGAVQHRLQIGARRARAGAAAAGLLAPADAIGVAADEVVDVGLVFEPDLLAGLDHRLAQRRPVHLRREQRPLAPAHLAALLARPLLGLLEIRQHRVPVPAAIAELRPWS